MRFPQLNVPSQSGTRRQPQLRRLVTTLPVLLASLGLVTVAGPRAYAAGASCAASYLTTSQFADGFYSTVTVTNTGTTALTGWTVTFTFGGDQQVTTFYNAASVTESKESTTAINPSWDDYVPVGGSQSFGLIGSWGTSDAPPATLTCTATS